MSVINKQLVTNAKIEAEYSFMDDKLFLQPKKEGETIFVNLHTKILHYTRRKSDPCAYTIKIGKNYNKLEIDYRNIPHLMRIIESQDGFNGEKLEEYINLNIEQFKKNIADNTSIGYNFDKKYYIANKEDENYGHNEIWLASTSECRQEIKKILSNYNLDQFVYSQLCAQVDKLEAISPYS